MINSIKPEDILFLDIETVPQQPNFDSLSTEMQALWDKKSKQLRTDDRLASETYERAGIYAEFGKIICISAGFIYKKEKKLKVRIKSFASEDEKKLLDAFKSMIEKLEKDRTLFLCAHNGKEFDFPYIARRMLINGLVLPKTFNVAGKKPWEVPYLDTLELWRFGDYKNYTSLDLLTQIFNIPTPKADMDGSMVAGVFWEEKNLDRIVTYCEQDVIAIIQLYRKYRVEPMIELSDVEIISPDET